jgi:hypothetical protein
MPETSAHKSLVPFYFNDLQGIDETSGREEKTPNSIPSCLSFGLDLAATSAQ